MPEEVSICHTIVHRIATYEGCDPVELPPMFEEVDPDALDSLFLSSPSGDITLQFTYAGYEITVEAADEPIVTVVPAEGSSDSSS